MEILWNNCVTLWLDHIPVRTIGETDPTLMIFM